MAVVAVQWSLYPIGLHGIIGMILAGYIFNIVSIFPHQSVFIHNIVSIFPYRRVLTEKLDSPWLCVAGPGGEERGDVSWVRLSDRLPHGRRFYPKAPPTAPHCACAPTHSPSRDWVGAGKERVNGVCGRRGTGVGLQADILAEY